MGQVSSDQTKHNTSSLLRACVLTVTLNVHYHPCQTSTDPLRPLPSPPLRPSVPTPLRPSAPTPAVREEEEEEEEETGGDDDEEEDGAWGEGRSTKRHDAPIVPVPPSLNVIEHDPLEVAARRGGWEVRTE